MPKFPPQKPFSYIAPAITGQNYHNAQVLGNSVWLWMQSASYRPATLKILQNQMLPALSLNQFALAFDQAGRPLFYMTWALFDQRRKAEYIEKGNLMLNAENWNCGDRLWLIYWLAPFGGSPDFAGWVSRSLFPRSVMRFLYHQGKNRGLKVLVKGGAQVPRETVLDWHARHPLPDLVPVVFPRG